MSTTYMYVLDLKHKARFLFRNPYTRVFTLLLYLYMYIYIYKQLMILFEERIGSTTTVYIYSF